MYKNYYMLETLEILGDDFSIGLFWEPGKVLDMEKSCIYLGDTRMSIEKIKVSKQSCSFESLFVARLGIYWNYQ